MSIAVAALLGLLVSGIFQLGVHSGEASKKEEVKKPAPIVREIEQKRGVASERDDDIGR